MQKALKWLCSENNAIALAASFKKQMIALLLSPPAGQGMRDYFFPIPVFSVATRGGGSYFILSLCVKSRVDGMPGNRRSVLGSQTPSSRAKVPPKRTRGELRGGNPLLRPSEQAVGTPCAHLEVFK